MDSHRRLTGWLCLLAAVLATPAEARTTDVDVLDVADNGRGRAPCTGIRVGNTILTASHCVGGGPSFVGNGKKIPFERVEVLWERAELDLALLSVPRWASQVPPLKLARPLNEARLPKLLVITRGGLQPVNVLGLSGRYVWVRPVTASFCFGDSGAPLVVHFRGKPSVVGVLNVGDAKCSLRGKYRFARIDNVVDLPAVKLQ